MKQPKDDLWAVIGTADDDGIVASILPNLGSTPLVSLNEARIGDYEWLAQTIADATGKTLEVVRYRRAAVVRTIRPRPQG